MQTTHCASQRHARSRSSALREPFLPQSTSPPRISVTYYLSLPPIIPVYIRDLTACLLPLPWTSGGLPVERMLESAQNIYHLNDQIDRLQLVKGFRCPIGPRWCSELVEYRQRETCSRLILWCPVLPTKKKRRTCFGFANYITTELTNACFPKLFLYSTCSMLP